MKLAEKLLSEYETKARKGGNETSRGGSCVHTHHYRVDTAGNGSTTFTSGECDNHFHDIKDYQVMPSTEDNHTHVIATDENLSSFNFDETPSFKTMYGFQHWLEKLAKTKSDYDGSVIVNNKKYKSVKDAADKLWKGKKNEN